MQERKTVKDIQSILSEVKFMDWELRLLEKGDGFLIQWVFMDFDVENPTAGLVPQHCRKWYISPYSTTTEIVETAWKAAWIAILHETKEKFTYKGRRIYSPHFDVEARITMCDTTHFDRRK